MNSRPIPPAYLEDILEAGRRLSSLVDDILDFSQLDARKRQLVWEPVAIQELIDYQQELYHGGSASASACSSTSPPGDAKLQCDLDRSSLSKVLGHIIANALRYSRARPSRSASSGAHSDNALSISISDRGPGIPKSIKDNLDEPFSIGQEVLTKDASGLGLGLTICRHLMTMMGGRIMIQDRDGGGGNVTLLLPDLASPALAS